MERQDLPLYNANRFKLGIFCMNVSHGTSMTTAEGTLTPTWEENVRIAQAADEAGWEFLLPLGRWRGFGGRINFNDATFEVYTWAAGIAAVTRQIQVFTTSHIRMVHPVMGAKQGATVDHIAGGRSAVNVVAGQKPGEIGMFGLDALEHDASYAAADEWITLVKRLWTEEEDFDFEGRYFRSHGAHLMPKPLQKPYPVVVNAGSSPAGMAFGAEHADFTFETARDMESLQVLVDRTKHAAWDGYKKELGILIHAFVVCRDTEQEARDYVRYCFEEKGDWEAADSLIDTLIRAKGQGADFEKLRIQMRQQMVAGWGGYPLIGTPEQIVEKLQALSAIGVTGAALHWVNYEAGVHQFNEQVLPLMVQAGLREPRPSGGTESRAAAKSAAGLSA